MGGFAPLVDDPDDADPDDADPDDADPDDAEPFDAEPEVGLLEDDEELSVPDDSVGLLALAPSDDPEPSGDEEAARESVR